MTKEASIEVQTFSLEEVLDNCLKYFDGDELAAEVFINKYALKNKKGELIENSPDMMHKRFAKEFARIEQKYPNPMSEDEIYDNLKGFKYICPQGSPSAAIGDKARYQSLSNCFVIEGPSDSYGGIMKTDQEEAQIMKRRGGVGFDISNLRPKGLQTSNAAGTTDGIEVFMKRFSNTCEEVAQGGRRGALLLSIDAFHAQVEDFIEAKMKGGITGANVSIRAKNKLFEAILNDEEIELKWPVNSDNPEISKTVKAKDYWKKFVHAVWTSSDPGIQFLDNIRDFTPSEVYEEFQSVSSNPCLTGDTLVYTNAGSKTIKELSEQRTEFYVKSYDKFDNTSKMKKATAFKTRDNAKVLMIKTKSGKQIKLTEDHQVYTQRGWIEAKDLIKSDKILSIKNHLLDEFEFDEIVEISEVENEDVYDISVEELHNFFANDLLVHNCGEQYLGPHDVCRLLLLNSYSYVENIFAAEAKFNLKKFEEHTMIALRLLDDLVDLESEAIDRIIRKIESDPEDEETKRVEINLWKKVKAVGEKGRRTGLGLTGIADTIAALGMKYGSDDSIEFVEYLTKHFAIASHRASVNLAKERGAFPAYQPGVFEKSKFIQRLMSVCDDELNQDFTKYGRRNVCLTTIPPAGSTSMMAQVSSGIEPVLFVESTRRRRVNTNDKFARVDETDDKGENWQYYDVSHRGHNLWKQINPDVDISNSPYNGSTINDIDPYVQVKIQAAAQKWIENAISKTINVKENITEQQISDVLIEAWRLGCKGTTVYRYGSKKGIIFEKTDQKTEQPTAAFVENFAPKRPKSLECSIHTVSVKGEKWTILVGLFEGKPYEVFGGLSKYVEIPKKVKSGIIIKNGKKDGVVTYNLSFGKNDDEILIKDIVSVFDNPTHGALTRVISLSLRHGAPVQFVAEQLQKDKDSDITSFSRVLARVLKSYILDGTTARPLCEECGGVLVYQSGCLACLNCSWSKCG